MTTKFAAIVLAASALHIPAFAVDSVSVEYGTGNHTDVYRVGAQWNWGKQWWQSNGTHIGGYWDLNLGQWRGNRYQNIPGNHQNITVAGITPVFRFQKDNLQGWYGELGIGANLLSGYYDVGGRRFSTRFQFGDHIGIGYVFSNKVDVGLRYQHFSNASIDSPNPGVNYTVLRVSYPLGK
ncbi:acyloxyacyl hydrolase [Paucimonas lemoignei]|nr:acyloxyacyl hydrolase [Paucimonas lemoignei]